MVDHSYDPIADAPSGQAGEGGGERIAKLLARAGVGSRRDVERMIEEGRVAINGRVLSEPGIKPGPDDIITVDGAVVGEPEPTRMWRYHKPTGLITSHKDPQGRPTVFDALPEDLPRVISVGRLDINSEGLLLLTNDGELARALEQPATGWVRRYRARAHGRTTQEALDKLRAGVTVDGVHYGPIEARLDKAKESAGGANVWISVALTEGKNREVRKVLESIGLKVNRLIRLSYGPFQLGTLAQGAAEEIGPRVIREQLAGLVAPENMPKGDRVPKAGLQAPARRPAGPLVDEKPEKAKKVYKAGWAKPKAKANPKAGPARPKPRAKPKGTDLTPRPARGGAARKPGGPASRPRPPK